MKLFLGILSSPNDVWNQIPDSKIVLLFIPSPETTNQGFAFPALKRRGGSPDFKSKTTIHSKLRRSKSLADLRSEPNKTAVKRLNAGFELIPSKRMKPNVAGSSAASKQLPIRSQAKKAAILNTLKSSSSNNVLKVVQKATLTKSVSHGATANPPRFAATGTIPKTNAPVKAAPAKPAAVVAKPVGKSTGNMKPAPYDFKARFGLLKEKYDDLKAKHDEQKEQMANFEDFTEQTENRERDLLQKQRELEAELLKGNEINEMLKREIQDLKTVNSNLGTKNRALATTLSSTTEELDELKTKQIKLEKIAQDHEKLLKKTETLQNDYDEASKKLVTSQEQLYQMNTERMVLHNMVLDLRGNIRVFARVRPPLSAEENKQLCGWSFVDETSLEIHSNELVPTGGRKQTKHDFSFDHVFNPNTAQDEIFDIVSPLIQSALDGYNVCIFAYGMFFVSIGWECSNKFSHFAGQTGSGKTFTMEGAAGHQGIIPRTVKLLFDSVKSAAIMGWTYKITASFLEIYNEVLYDLLSNEDKEIEIRMASAKNKTEIYVSNIELKTVTSASMLYELMKIASSNRATAATAGNERSSRSHAVTRLEVVGTHASKPESLVGFINLVDLAGSESPKTSTRMDETKNINKSLSELSNVILALVQKNDHVPYRNSKLTHLLMPSLGGNSKTLMFVNVSPFQENFGESVKSLRFAAQVNSCKLAKAKRNRQLSVAANVTN